ncbi:hypothetical protein EJB05_56335, partial [Eragrostis curvula]
MEFMVGFSEASMATLLKKLCVLLAREYTLIRGVNGDIQDINDELSSIHAFLLMCAMQAANQGHDFQNQSWVRQVRDFSYDIEDSVDEFAHRFGRQSRADGFISSIISRLQALARWYPRRNIVLELKELKDRYGVERPLDLQDYREEEIVRRARLTADTHQVRGRQLVGVKDPVGMGGIMKELGSWLSDAEKKQGVLALVGFSGVGKTTLATALYRNFQDQFDARAWVTVSQKFNLESVLRSILSQVVMLSTDLVKEEMNENQLRDRLHSTNCLLRDGALREEELFQLSDSCGGLPLAIVIMAGVVANSNKWRQEGWDTQTPQGVESLVAFSYNDLPMDLKTCMLHLCTFPKSYKINRKRLTRRWVAEGLLGAKHGLSAEEVAEEYFNQLITRNIIRPVEHSTDGMVKACQVHDMIHEYIVHKSGEEDLVNVVGGHWLMPVPSNKVRRLSLHTTDHVEAAIASMNLSRIRSLTVCATSHKFPFHSFKSKIIQVLDLEGCRGIKKHHLKRICEMTLLKFLSLRKTDIDKLPSNIGNLIYLETLDIRETKISVLPKSILELHLLTNLFGGNKKNRKTVKLPKEMATRPIVTLQILSGIEIVEGPATISDLHAFTKLKKLLIYKLNLRKDSLGFKDLMSSIEYLGFLQSLEIDDESSDFINSLDSMASPPRHLTTLHLHGKLLTVPEWIPNLEDLVKLTLSVTVLRTDTFKLLASMPLLFCLTFSYSFEKQNAHMVTILEKNELESGGTISVPSGRYKSLKLLRFASPVLPQLNFSEGAMPELQRIDLQFTKLEGLSNMDNLVSIEEVHLTMNKQADEATKGKVNELSAHARSGANKLRVTVNAW